MRTINSMLSEYAESHQNRTNQIVHKICVPVIVFSVIGLLMSIPMPASAPAGLNIGLIAGFLALMYYFVLSRKYFLLMTPQIVLMYLGNVWIRDNGNLLIVSIVLFVISWAFQFWGHKIEGKKPSFLKDLLFLLIGPLWVTKALLNLKD